MVRITRVIAADRERVWSALTEQAALAAWFWPPRMVPAAALDLRVGGAYRIWAGDPEVAVFGRLLEVDPPRRLVLSWQWEGDDEESLVTFELTEVAEKTELLVLHERLRDPDSHAKGWGDCLDRLPAYLADRPA